MGNQAGSLKKHIETAEKTGALSFSDKGLEKFPPELAKVANNLRNLDLSGNKLVLLPVNVGAFKMLKNLTLTKNRLTSLPDDMGKLTKLENLQLSYNAIQTIPETFQQLKNLKEIYLAGNKLTKFPSCLCGLKQLNILDLSANSIREVPDSVGSLEATELVLNQNQISALSPKLADCPRLRTLRLEENCLSLQTIPSGLLSDSGVSLLALEGNLFDVKSLDQLPGWEKYMDRYTAVKRKLD